MNRSICYDSKWNIIDDISYDDKTTIVPVDMACPTPVTSSTVGIFTPKIDYSKYATYKPKEHKVTKPVVKEVIFAPPATIVYWTDGSRTVVKCDKNDIFNEEIGFALCYIKKILGNRGHYNTYIAKSIKNAKRYYKEPPLLSPEELVKQNEEVNL